MSIILIDDVLFNDNNEQRKIRYNNCIFFLVLNGISIFSGIFYLYFYFIIPYYQNSSNSLSLFLNIFHLISNSFYFIIFFELYIYEPTILSLTIKIITMFNPLIILCIYYWTACITHNLYVTYYNYSHNMDKRIKMYKYLLFIISIILYIYTLFNIQYNDSQLLSKSFTFISNYSTSFIDFFYICGIFIILYIIIKLYYVINKKEDFISVHEYQENEERNKKIKNIFNSVIARNISFVCYFLITFTPANILMLFKYFLGKSKIHSYFIDYMVIMLISFNGSFLFIVRLFDQLMRSFIINLLLFNREFISKYEENLLKEKGFNESLIETDNESFSTRKSQVRYFPPINNYHKLISVPIKKLNSEKNLYCYEFNNPVKKFSHTSDLNRDLNQCEKYEMNVLNINNNNNNNKKYAEDYIKKISEKTEDKENDIENENENENESNSSLFKSNNQSEQKSIKSIYKEIIDEKGSESEKESEKEIDNNITNIKTINVLEDKDKNSQNNSYFRINSTESNDKFREQSQDKDSICNNNNIFTRIRSNTICHTQAYDQIMVNRANKISNRNKNSLFITSFRRKKNNNSNNDNNKPNTRANSSTTHTFKRKFLPQTAKKRRSASKTSDFLYHEEISSFALMNFHLEINENLLRLIAISISLNECRIYDNVKEYKKYYTSTIPWENKDFYKEKTLFKEYNNENFPTWLGIENDARFNGIQFKIMSFCPFVFHHIRYIDNISIDDILLSLDPIRNIKKIKEMKVSGGRGNNSLTSTWDKKIIVKTINEDERQILIDKMIIDYHCLMNESKSILSRIYGLFRLELRDKGCINVIIQRNMNELPLETKLLTFDFKGSTVDRQTIDKNDVDLGLEKIITKYKNKVLKDIDLGIVGLKFSLNSEDCKKLNEIIDKDSIFLENLEVTDYSLVVFIHKNRLKEKIHNKGCSRIIESKDGKYLFNFAIVDFLGTFNIEKKGEKLAKSLVGYIKKLKDTNFSVLDPFNYGVRFRNFCKTIIIDT